MNRIAEFRCRCERVRGRVTGASPAAVNRVVCYCDDCQTFLHHIGRPDLLDAHGGSDVVQVAPASLTFTAGTENITGVRLSPKGLYRWYSSCCNTPLGNHVGPALPFVGIMAQVFDGGREGVDEIFGKPIGAVALKYAVGSVPKASQGSQWLLMMRAIRSVLAWKLRGRTWPHPFYDREKRTPLYPITVLPLAERQALRQLCGPHPATTSAAPLPPDPARD